MSILRLFLWLDLLLVYITMTYITNSNTTFSNDISLTNYILSDYRDQDNDEKYGKPTTY